LKKLTTREVLNYLVDILTAGRFDYIDEVVCQNQIEEHLLKLEINYKREYRLGDGGIVDFYFPKSGIGLEVKASKQWSKIKVFRQCERYCKNPQIKGLLLATARSQALPESIEDKPVEVFSLGVSQL